jgi:hypothetical protein
LSGSTTGFFLNLNDACSAFTHVATRQLAQYFSIDPGCWSSFAQADALANLLIEKGIITQQEFLAKIFRRASDISGDVQVDTTLTQ